VDSAGEGKTPGPGRPAYDDPSQRRGGFNPSVAPETRAVLEEAARRYGYPKVGRFLDALALVLEKLMRE
jgi:hypothetical protein